MRKKNLSANSIQIIWFFLKRHLAIYTTLAILGLVIGVLEAVNLAVFIPMLDDLVGASPTNDEGGENNLIKVLNVMVAFVPIDDRFIAAAILFLGLTLAKGLLSLLYEYLTALASGNILQKYRAELISRYRDAPLSFFQIERAGSLVYSLSSPPTVLSKLLYTLPRVLVDFLRFFFVMTLLFYMDPDITLGVAVIGLVLYLGLSKPLSKHSYRLSSTRREAEQDMSVIATEWLRGIRPIRTANAENHWIDSYLIHNERSRTAYIKTSFLLASPRHIFEMIAFSALFIGMIVIYWRDPTNFASQVATIGLFAMGLMRVLPSFSTLARAPLDIKTMLPDVQNLYGIFQKLPEKDIEGSVEFKRLEKEISLQDISVVHQGRGAALTSITLKIPKNKVVAFVGASGAGKTTLLNTLIGAQSLSSGKVLYDNVNIAKLNKASLLRRVGYVGQDVLLFHGTIQENISYFKDIPLEAIKASASMAEISDFIESLPDGYDSMVGEAGVNFSGGQAQRLAIARAIVHNPDILILDEATSALDATSEKMVVGSLQHASKNRTVVMVTHRLSTVKWADIIYVLEGGKLAETGTWRQLVGNKSSRFYKMCKEQDHLNED